ncbi:L,D-transpeptidase family protein [Planctomycetota bacterium]
MARTYGPRRGGRRVRNRRYLTIAAVIAVAGLIYYFGFHSQTPEVEPLSSINNIPTNINIPGGNTTENPLTGVSSTEQTELETEESALENPVIIPEDFQFEPNPAANTLIARAQTLLDENTNNIIAARDVLDQAMRMQISHQQRESIKQQLTELAEKWLFSRTVYPDDPLCENYQVKPGEILETISKNYLVPFEFIMERNNIARPELLPAGARIKVVNGPFHVKIYRSSFTMDIYLQNSYVRTYRIGLGLAESETPTGLWRVEQGEKMESPPWYDEYENRTYYPEDPDYPLGSRWIGLEGLEGNAKYRTGFAIHGTKVPEQIGTVGSRGCIRMFNGDVIEVYDMLYPVESLVEVTD